jgi:hypothetical protein
MSAQRSLSEEKRTHYAQYEFCLLTQHGHMGTFHMAAVSSDTARRNLSVRWRVKPDAAH